MPEPTFQIPNFEYRRRKAEKAIEPVVFAPVRRDPLKAQTKIKMLNSVHGRFKNGKHFELIGGKSYWVDELKADEWIIKGYATGKLSKNYTELEKQHITANIQVIQGPGSKVTEAK